jgi:DNA invertase Pin-like site-specific DNA recombinase
MLIGYMRVSKSDGSQTTDLQRDALLLAGVEDAQIFEDQTSGKTVERPGLSACLRALRSGDTLLVWKLDRLGRDLRNLIGIVRDLEAKSVGFKVLAGSGAEIDTTTANGRLVFGIFAALAEYERELIVERTKAGLVAARARGRQGGAEWKMNPLKIEMARAALVQKDTNVSKLCSELRISRQTLYRHLSPQGELRHDGKKLLERHQKIGFKQPLAQVKV